MLSCLAVRSVWHEASSGSCLSWVEGDRRPAGAGSSSAAHSQEQGHLRGTMWGPVMGPFSHRKTLSCPLGCLARPWCGHNPDTAATVCPAVGWGTRAQGPLCGLSGDLHPTLNNRVESQAGAGPRVVCCESAPSEQMKAGRWLARGQWAGRRAAPSQGRNWGSHGPGVD